jgi:hypothetical protein
MERITPITGGCYCGKVRFRVNGSNLRQSNCHCANCRRAAGAQSVAWITVKLSEFAFEKVGPKPVTNESTTANAFAHSTKLVLRRRPRGAIRVDTLCFRSYRVSCLRHSMPSLRTPWFCRPTSASPSHTDSSLAWNPIRSRAQKRLGTQRLRSASHASTPEMLRRRQLQKFSIACIKLRRGRERSSGVPARSGC